MTTVVRRLAATPIPVAVARLNPRRAAADRENRSQANMLDVLLSDYCARNGIEIADESNLNSAATEQLGGEKNLKKGTGTRND